MHKRVLLVGITILGALALSLVSLQTRPKHISAGGLPTPDYAIDVSAPTGGTGHNVAGDTITFHAGASGLVYELYGISTTTLVVVEGAATNVTFIFNGIDLQTNTTPFVLQGGAEVTILLAEHSSNTLRTTGPTGNGLNMMPGSTLAIDGDYSAELTLRGATTSNNAALRVGSGNSARVGDAVLTIMGGTIVATAGTNDAGIGGNLGEVGGTIIIYGGNITATSTHGAGIGGGHSSPAHGPNILIRGGTIDARSSASGAGIGSGMNNNGGGIITIEGGNIIAVGNTVGIGGTNGVVTINEDANVVAFSTGVGGRAIGAAGDTILADDENHIVHFAFAANVTAMTVEARINGDTVRTFTLPASRAGAITLPESGEVEFFAFTLLGEPLGVIVNVIDGDPLEIVDSGNPLVFNSVQLINFITVTFNTTAQGFLGTEGVTTRTFFLLPGEAFNLNNSVPTATSISPGLTFDEWVFQSTVNEFTPSSSFTTNQIIVATWRAPDFTIYFDINFAEGTNPTAQEVTYNQPVGGLPTPSRPGHNFDGWRRDVQDPATLYTATTVFSTLGDITLTAAWSLATFEVTFVTGVPFMVVPSTDVTFTHLFGTLPQLERRGYTFVGWFTNLADETSIITATTEFTFTNDIELHAKWQEETPPMPRWITMPGGAGIEQEGPPTITDETRPGYRFLGWAITSDDDGIIMTAQWERLRNASLPWMIAVIALGVLSLSLIFVIITRTRKRT